MKHRVAFNRKAYHMKNTAFALFILAVCLFVFPMSALADGCTDLQRSVGGTINLGGDTCTLTDQYIPTATATITNGRIITSVTNVIEAKGVSITLGEGLTITGSSSVLWAHSSGTITVDGADITSTSTKDAAACAQDSGSSIVFNSGSIKQQNIKSGSIKQQNTKKLGPVTINVVNGATVTINDGTLLNVTSTVLSVDGSGSDITVNGGTITTESENVAGQAKNNGLLTVNGGTINSNGLEALAAIRDGQTAGGEIVVNGGTINKAVGAYEGSDSKVTVKGGTIGDQASWGVYINDGASGEISGGMVKGYAQVGANSGTLKIKAGTFSQKPIESYIDEYSVPVDNGDGTWSVKIAVYVKPDASQSKTYDGNPEIPGSYSYQLFNAKGGNNTGKFNISGALSREPGEDANTYEYNLGTLALAEQHVEAGYQLILAPDEGVAFTINPKQVATIREKVKTPYTGEAQFPTVTYKDINGETHPVTLKLAEGDDNKNVGKYQVFFSIDDHNYVPDRPHQYCYITPAELTLAWVGPFEFEYNGEEQHPNFTLTGCVGSDAEEGGDTCTDEFVKSNFTVTGSKKDVGNNYSANVVRNDDVTNYTLSEAIPGNFIITPKPIKLNWDDDTGKILLEYNGQSQSPTVTIPEGSIEEGDTCTLKIEGERLNVGLKRATASLDGTGCNNYKITNPSAIFQIVPKTVDLTWEGDTFTYTGYEQKPTASYKDVNDNTVEVPAESIQTDPFSSVNADSYSALAESDDPNYQFSETTATHAFTITRKTVNVTWNTKTFEYNGEIQRPEPSIEEGGLAPVDADRCVVVSKGGKKDASETAYTANAQWAKASDASCESNYMLENTTHDYYITPKELTLTWAENVDHEYDGEAYFPEFTLTGCVGTDGDSVGICTDEFIGNYINKTGASVNVGTTTYTASVSMGENQPNYKLTGKTDTSFVITPAEVAIEWSNVGPFTYINKKAQAPTAQYKDLNDKFIDAFITITDADGNKIDEAVDAGDYTATASIADPNYTFENIDDAERSFTINKAKVTVVPTEPLSKRYGSGVDPIFEYQIMNAKGTQDVRYTVEQNGSYLTRENNSVPDQVGFYKFIIDNITLKDQYDKNYELVLGDPKYFRITDGEIDPIEFPTVKDDLVYNGTAQELFNAGTAEHGIFMYSVDEETWSPDMPVQTNAGDYTYYYYIKGDENYEDKWYDAEGNPFEITGKIQRAKLTVTPDSGQTKVYGEADPIAFTYSVSGKVNDEEPVFTGALKRQKGEKGENVGTYFIRKGDLKLDPDVEVNKNYDPELGWTNGVLFTITQRVAQIAWDEETLSFDYDGTSHVPTAYVNNLVEGDKCEVNVNGAQMNVGEHTATATGLSNTNYVLPEDENYRIISFVIKPAKVTVTADNKSKIYGTEDPKLTATVTGLKGSDTEDVITYTLTREDNENVGEYAITSAGDKDQGNYEVSFEPGTFSINPAKVTVKVTGRNVEAVYDGEQHSTVYDMKVMSDESGKYDLNDVQFVGTAWRVDKVDVGEYDLILSTGDFKNKNKNYEVDFQVSSGKLTITEAFVTVTVTGRNVIADYDGEVHSTVYDMEVTDDKTGKYDLDDVKFVGTAWRVDKTDAGEYDLTLSERDFDNTNKNFDVTFQVTSGKLTINQAKVTVTADDKTKVYGAADPELTAKVEGLKGGDSEDVITYTLNRAEGDDVGEYAITPSGEVSQGNYKVTYKPGTLTIGQAKVTVKVTGRNVEAVYDGKVHTTVYDMAVTSDESGKYNLDDVRITGAAWRIDKTDAGEYELKLMPSNFSNINENFNVEFETENGNLTIKPLLAVIEWSDLQKFYNGQAQYPTATVKNKIGEDICDVTVEAKDGKTPVSAGTYTAVAVGLSNTNYTLDPDALPSTDYQIFAKLAEVEWSEPEKVYNGEAQLPTATIKASDLVAGDTCTVVVEIENGEAVNADKYTAKAVSFKEELCKQNYSLSGENLTTDFTITPKTVTLTWTPDTNPILFSYDGQPHRPKASYTNVKDETVDVKDEEIMITPDGQAVNFGEYTATAESADKNYVFSKDTASKEFQIVAKVIKVVPDKDQRMIYGTPDEELNLTYTLRDEDGNTVSEPVLEGKLGHEGTTVGQYLFDMGTLALKSEDKDNYMLTLDTSVKFTIEAKPVSITWGNTELTYNGEKQVPVAFVPDEEIVDDDTVKVVYSDDSYQTDADEGYTAKVTGLDNENYTLKDGPAVTTTFSIARANFEPGEDFTPPDDIEGLSYNGQPQNLITGGTGDCVNKGTCTILYEITDFESEMITKEISSEIPQGTDAGTYTISWMIKGDKNHNDYLGGTIKVRLAPTALSNANIVITPGTSFVYDHTQKSVEYTVVGSDGSTPLTKGVDYTVVKAETSAFAVGTYEIVINGLGGYTGTNVRKTWEIIDNETIKPFEFYRLNGFWDRETNCPTFGCGQQLPATGFPTRFRMPLSVRPDGLKYQDLGMRLQIPALAVNVDLVGVPKLGTDWAIEWLGADAGILSGTSEPGRGYTMIAGHNHLNESEMGPFLNLGSLKQYDTIYISLENGMNLPFSVYANELMRPDDYEAIAKIAAEDPNSIVLVTCENETAAGGYMNRRVVFAKPF